MIVSVTHELDLDGLGSQAIIQRYFNHFLKKNKSELNLHYAHYTNFIDKIREILDVGFLPEQLIISDIGFNDDFKKLYPLFKKFKENNGIVIIDHLSSLVKNLKAKGIDTDLYTKQKDALESVSELIKMGAKEVAFTQFTKAFPYCLPHRSIF